MVILPSGVILLSDLPLSSLLSILELSVGVDLSLVTALAYSAAEEWEGAGGRGLSAKLAASALTGLGDLLSALAGGGRNVDVDRDGPGTVGGRVGRGVDDSEIGTGLEAWRSRGGGRVLCSRFIPRSCGGKM